MKIEFSRQFFEKYSDIKFHENPCSGSRVVRWGQTDGRTDLTKLIFSFRNFANAPINITHVPKCSIKCSDTPKFTIHPISRPHYCIHGTWEWSTMKPNISLFFLPVTFAGSGTAVWAFPTSRHSIFHAPWLMSSRSYSWPFSMQKFAFVAYEGSTTLTSVDASHARREGVLSSHRYPSESSCPSLGWNAMIRTFACHLRKDADRFL